MEQIHVGGTDFLVAVVIHPVDNQNEFKYDVTVRHYQFDRIKHVDIIALRKEYDKVGYTGELKLVLKQGYEEDYPCSSFINNPAFFSSMTEEERDEFIDRVNKSKIPEILRKK
ncbi:hypothetical protein CPT_Merlin60 [Citrobacter phage Merlin]|uniref:Uncharacterized protein n=1 Tax=Citrobacter phage Merlin TaxID=1675602 RepID=A0A0K1LMG5_9CAUD|nr:hypothetical protein CPT_Merlin60 [Citrobacter phage Merlin]AKU43706.1 hypothetical protein CPT_Merlin60 [Citrobacter phage Merlin]